METFKPAMELADLIIPKPCLTPSHRVTFNGSIYIRHKYDKRVINTMESIDPLTISSDWREALYNTINTLGLILSCNFTQNIS